MAERPLARAVPDANTERSAAPADSPICMAELMPLWMTLRLFAPLARWLCDRVIGCAWHQMDTAIIELGRGAVSGRAGRVPATMAARRSGVRGYRGHAADGREFLFHGSRGKFRTVRQAINRYLE